MNYLLSYSSICGFSFLLCFFHPFQSGFVPPSEQAGCVDVWMNLILIVRYLQSNQFQILYNFKQHVIISLGTKWIEPMLVIIADHGESVIGLCILHKHERYLFLRLIFNHKYFSINRSPYHQAHFKEGQHFNYKGSDFKDKTELIIKNSRKAVVFGSVSVKQTFSSQVTERLLIHFWQQ